jgi:type VI secretion system secreted protein VgrG
MSTVDIIEDVFGRAGFTDFEPLSVKHGTDSIPYCVQYGESDFDFISRLMEEAGIAYYFTHDKDRHMLVLFDDPSQNSPCPGANTIQFLSGQEQDSGKPAIDSWSVRHRIHTGAVAMRSYDFEDPGLDLSVTQKTTNSIGENDRFERYEYSGVYKGISQGDAMAKVVMEASEASSCEISASSNCAPLTPGYRFDLEGHKVSSFDGTYLITAVDHDLEQDVGSGSSVKYENRLRCMPHEVPYRPMRVTPKPRIHGAQTAVVVGASTEEVDVDEFGRVVVQFPWDREGKNDEKSSCRVRVSQNWAGKGWGAMFHPRIGQEVIVEYLEGDPDRPVVTGRVYNGAQKVPYALPANKTQSGIKSRSSKEGGADNFNEIRFEDKKGSELLFMQAEKDRDTQIKNNETKSVGVDQSLTVGNDRSVSVDGNHTEGVSGDQNVEIGANRTDKVTENETREVGVNRERSVGESETISIGKKQEIAVGEARSVTVGEDDSLAVSGALDVTVDEDFTVQVTKDYALQAEKVSVQASKEISLSAGDAKIVLKKNGDITIKGKKISIKGSGDVVVKGSKVAQN